MVQRLYGTKTKTRNHLILKNSYFIPTILVVYLGIMSPLLLDYCRPGFSNYSLFLSRHRRRRITGKIKHCIGSRGGGGLSGNWDHYWKLRASLDLWWSQWLHGGSTVGSSSCQKGILKGSGDAFNFCLCVVAAWKSADFSPCCHYTRAEIEGMTGSLEASKC